MQHDNVFLYLTSADSRNKASSVIKLPKNSRWYCDAQGGVEGEPTVTSRDPTPAPDEVEEDAPDHTSLDVTERLAITFTGLQEACQDGSVPVQSAEAGVVFGTDPRFCHVVLGFRGTVGISRNYFAIRTDSSHQIVLADLGSTHGTAVETNGQNRDQRRSWDQWILTGQPGSDDRFSTIIVWLGELALNLVLPNHHKSSPRYLERLTNFTKAWGVSESVRKEETFALNALDLQSHLTTQAPSGSHTPSSTPIYYRDRRIGQGAFGQVHRVIKMSDGKYYAAKTFTRKDKKRERDSSDPRWLASIRREFTLVNENPHFFIDIAIWGLGLNNSAILSAIGFSSAKIVYHSLQNTAVGNLILGLAGNIPDYLVSAATIDTLDRWPTQFGSSAILTVLFCIIKFAYHILASSSLLALYVLCQFFSNFGANSTTFVGIGWASQEQGGTNDWLNRVMQIFAAFVVCGLGTTLLIPETKRESLEYIAQKYHNEGGTEGAISEDERRAEEGEV
ncbi:hypothetical protein LTR35_017312 [Friedmanniomyces endolithicus]|nr:hypothetical protein LTR35_017312 [Friedmanniomyces endolithicus]KAK0270610.1 hypothetical protein LTS00_016892 [Friedmanniomyces endolithicus]